MLCIPIIENVEMIYSLKEMPELYANTYQTLYQEWHWNIWISKIASGIWSLISVMWPTLLIAAIILIGKIILNKMLDQSYSDRAHWRKIERKERRAKKKEEKAK